MIIWESFKLQNSQATITIAANNSGYLTIDSPIDLTHTVYVAGNIQRSSNASAGIYCDDNAISMWGATINCNSARIVSNGNNSWFTSFSSSIATINNATITHSTITNASITNATITTATITNLNLVNSVTLPAGSKIAGDIASFPCVFEVFGQNDNNLYKVTILNTTGLELKATMKGGEQAEQITINPYRSGSKTVGTNDNTTNVTITYTLSGTTGVITIPKTSLHEYPTVFSIDDLNPYRVQANNINDNPFWLWKILYYKKEGNIETGALLFSLLNDSDHDYDNGCDKIAEFYHAHQYQIGVCDEFNRRTPTWGTLYNNGVIMFPNGGNCSLSTAGTILFQTQS